MHDFLALEHSLSKKLPQYKFFSFNSIDSTNSFLKRTSRTVLTPSICICQRQTSGYGQRGREWLSNEDSLTFSLLSKLNMPIHKIDGFSQAVGLVLVRVLSELIGQDLKLKWPNDIYSERGKVAGLLIESVKFDESTCWLIVGIGINFSEISLTGGRLESRADYLNSNSVGFELQSIIFEALVYELDRLFSIYTFAYFQDLINEYQKYDYFDLDQELIVYDTGHASKGLYKGLTQYGELLFEIEGEIKTYRSGDVSIRSV